MTNGSENGSVASMAIRMSESEESKVSMDESDFRSQDGDVTSHMVARWYKPPEIILG
jgi:hypothetical protein